jgi:hypothetical protein
MLTVPMGVGVARRSQTRGKNTSAMAVSEAKSSGRGGSSRTHRRLRLSSRVSPSQAGGIAPSRKRIS